MPEQDTVEQDLRWDHDKAVALGWLLHEHPDFTEAFNEKQAVIEAVEEKWITRMADLRQKKLDDDLENLDDLPEDELRLRQSARAAKLEWMKYESKLEKRALSREQSRLIVEKSNVLLEVPEQVYDGDPKFYTTEAAMFRAHVDDVLLHQGEIEKLNQPCRTISEAEKWTAQFVEHQVTIDAAIVETARDKIKWAWIDAFGREDSFVEAIERDFNSLLEGRYTQYTPAEFTATNHEIAQRWVSNIQAKIHAHQQIIDRYLFRPTDED